MKKQSFIKGVMLLAAASIIAKFLGFIYRVVLTNLPGYGDEGNGLYGSGYQVYLVLYALSTTGFTAAVSKMVAEKTAVNDWYTAHKIFRVAFKLFLLTGITFSVILFISSGYISRLISNPRTVYTLMALSPTIFFVSLMAVFRGYFQGMGDMSPQAGSQIIEQLGKTVFTLILAYTLLPYGVEMSAAGATFGTSMGAAIGAVYLWNVYRRRKKELWDNMRRYRKRTKQHSTLSIVKNLLKISIPISLGALILTVTNIIDLTTVMAQLKKAGFDGSVANEMYGILTGKSYVLSHFPVSISMALSTGLVPAIAAAMAVGNLREVTHKITASLRLTNLIGLPASIGMAVLAEPILKMIFPGSSEGADLLTLSAFTIVFISLTQTMSGVLQGLGKPFIPALSLLAGAAVKFILNSILIPMPHINIKGAVYGTLACYLISTIINIIALKRNFKLNLNIYNFIMKPVAASILMGISTYYVYGYLYGVTANNFISVVISILTAVVIFVLVIIIMGGVSIRDISILPFGKNITKTLSRIRLLRR